MHQPDLFGQPRPTLRPYQLEAIDKLDEALRRGVRAALLVAPTGAGKTVIGAEIIRRAEPEATLFLAPRRELIDQTHKKLGQFGVRCGVILAGDNRMNLYAPVQVASVDTLISRVVRKNRLVLPTFKRIIIDEAHIGLTDTRQKLLDMWPDAKLIGLTATPCRSDGKALGRLFEELIEVTSVAQLVYDGHLCRARYFSPTEPDLERVRTTAGDYNQKDLDTVMAPLIGDVVQHWLEHAADRRTVVFATSIGHSVALAGQFVEHGVSAEHVDATTPTREREAIFSRFSNGETQVLTNCTLASVGFDLPELDCVVFARPTKSLGLYIQMLGRGLRPAKGKKDCLVLDHAGNVLRHGLIDEERYWTLHGKYAEDQAKKEAAERKKKAAGEEPHGIKCGHCSAVFSGSRQCPECGWLKPIKPKPMSPHEGRLVELTGATGADSPAARKAFLWELVGYAKMRGHKPGSAAFKYRDKFGEWPPMEWNEQAQAAGGAEPSLQTLRWIKSKEVAWYKAKQKALA